jgi:hypothetical protein
MATSASITQLTRERVNERKKSRPAGCSKAATAATAAKRYKGFRCHAISAVSTAPPPERTAARRRPAKGISAMTIPATFAEGRRS